MRQYLFHSFPFAVVLLFFIASCTGKDKVDSSIPEAPTKKVNTPSTINVGVAADSIQLEVDSLISIIIKQSSYKFEYPNKLAVHRKIYVRGGNVPLNELLRKIERVTHTTTAKAGEMIKLTFAYKTTLCGKVIDNRKKAIDDVHISNAECGCWIKTTKDGDFCMVIFDEKQDSLMLTRDGYVPVKIPVSNKKPFIVVMDKI